MNNTVYKSESPVTRDDVHLGQLVWVDGIHHGARKLSECNRIVSISNGTVTMEMQYLADDDTGEKFSSCIDKQGVERYQRRRSTYFFDDLEQRVSGKGHVYWIIKLHKSKRNV
jgi:hypothetical protein